MPRDRDALLVLLRRAFIPALVRIDPETNLPQRRIARLSDIPREAKPLLEHLVTQRLLVMNVQSDGGETTVEVAHAAIFRQWGVLAQWLEEDAALLHVLEVNFLRRRAASPQYRRRSGTVGVRTRKEGRRPDRVDRRPWREPRIPICGRGHPRL